MKKIDIEKMKEELIKLILDGADYGKIYEASTSLDELITNHYNDQTKLKKIS